MRFDINRALVILMEEHFTMSRVGGMRSKAHKGRQNGTDTESITDSKTIRKLSKGEIIEVMEFAKKVVQGIKRVKGKAKEDGASGWITVCGNQGTTFLEPC